MKPETVLRTFAKLAAERSISVRTNVLSPGSTFLWQRYRALDVFRGKSISPSGMPVERGLNKGSSLDLWEDRVLATAHLHEGERQLYVGWIWFSGTLVGEDGSSTSYCFPVVSVPVEFGYDDDRLRLLEGAVNGSLALPGAHQNRARREGSLIASGDVDLTDLVSGTDHRARLLDGRNFGGGELRDIYTVSTNEYTPVPLDVFPTLTGLNEWIDDAAKTIGLPVSQIKAAHQGMPVETLQNEFITVHIGSALYLEPPESLGARGDSLVTLSGLDGLEESALATLYDRTPIEPNPVASLSRLRPLSHRQATIAQDAGGAELSVVTGGPGTGKSHVLSVIAMNAIAQGESVLVVAGSPHAVDVIAEHFAKTPGPPPVIFGGSRYGQQIARDLAELASRAGQGGSARTGTGRHSGEEVERLLTTSHRLLDAEIEVARIQRDPGTRIDLAHAREQAGNLDELAQLLDRCERSGPLGWASRKRHQKKLDARLGQPANHRAGLDRLVRGAEAQRLHADGGLSLTETYDAIIEIEQAAAEQTGRALTEQWLSGMDPEQRTALAQISTALTSGRTMRRQMFAELEPVNLTTAAPLWIGSIRDVEDVLPEVAGMFDLLLVDEAAQIDQLNAVNALVRAKRSVICGDPHQLGHVSYMSQDDLRVVSRQSSTDGDILNVGELSVFDVAASRTPSHVLDEHFRSAPHIIEFSARRMYNGQLHVVGRNPANESADHIHVVHVTGQRNDDRINTAEVDVCIRLGEQLIEDGHTSIGFVSPFEEQSLALEEAILDRWQLEEIDAYGLRVGNVHGFQGDERDVIVASWAIGPDEGTHIWSYVNQPNLFNVMVTRARHEVYVVTSTEEPPGLAGDYLRWSEPLTNLVRDIESNDPWIAKVADTIRDAGYSVRMGYSVGRHRVDLVVDSRGGAESPLAIDCVPHPDGAEAHTDRSLQLRRVGWRTADFFESKWSERLGELKIELEHL